MDARTINLVNQKVLPFIFYEDRAEELVLKLYNEYVKGLGLYRYENQSTAPQNRHIPGTRFPVQEKIFDISPRKFFFEKAKGLKLIRWFFFSTLTDRRQVSDEVYRAHTILYAEYPELYTKKVVKVNPVNFGEFLAGYKIGVPRQSADYWVRCAKTLFEDFDGNPIKLIEYCGGTVEGVQAYKNRVERETGFDPLPGYGPKITSLFLLFMAELGVFTMPDDAFPVDVHIQALFLQYGAIVQTGVIANDALEIFLRPYLCKISREKNLNKVVLSHAGWIKGAKLCTGCSKRKYVHLLCSIEQECSGRIDTKKYYSEGVWTFPAQFMRKGCNREFALENMPLFD